MDSGRATRALLPHHLATTTVLRTPSVAGVMETPASQMRVYLDVDAFPARERDHWQAYVERGDGLSREQAAAVQTRVTASWVMDAPTAGPAEALVRRAGQRRLVCPLDLETRTSWAWGRLADQVSPSVLRAFVQDDEIRRQLDRSARSARAPSILDHPWAVPLQWYMAFDPAEQRRTNPAEGDGPRVRFLSTVGQAADRVDRALRIVTETIHADPDGTLTGLADLAGWLDAFPDEALLELDYGRLARELPAAQDHACSDLWQAIDALERDDLFGAIAAYGVARACWGDRRDHARLN